MHDFTGIPLVGLQQEVLCVGTTAFTGVVVEHPFRAVSYQVLVIVRR